MIDDSIVRGTTLRDSILKILERLHPRKIVIVSSSPQVRYPDYYGIDMPRLDELCAFRAARELWRERGWDDRFKLIQDACREELSQPSSDIHNAVRQVYSPFTVEEINTKMAEMLRPEGMETPVQFVFQSLEGLREACPGHKGDWYFSGRYPTPGGNRRVNESFLDYFARAVK